VGAGSISVAGPAADLTYGGGRTPTAMGAMGTIQLRDEHPNQAKAAAIKARV
jgi:hypothetical protein